MEEVVVAPDAVEAAPSPATLDPEEACRPTFGGDTLPSRTTLGTAPRLPGPLLGAVSFDKTLDPPGATLSPARDAEPKSHREGVCLLRSNTGAAVCLNHIIHIGIHRGKQKEAYGIIRGRKRAAGVRIARVTRVVFAHNEALQWTICC